MSKHSESIEAPTTGAAASTSHKQQIPFEHRNFGTAQLEQIWDCGTTTLFGKIIPQLKELGGIYYEGARLKATGAAILALRARKLAEPRGQMSALGSRGSKQLRKSRTKREVVK